MSRDMFGYPADVVAPHLIEGMFSPVKCAFCSGVYDLGKVEVTGRYVDCSVWRTPCCKNTADDRGDIILSGSPYLGIAFIRFEA